MNARFWTYANGGWIKLTLRPGDTLAHCTGGPTEEGWERRSETYEFDGRHVRREILSEGRDCDGYLSRFVSQECPLARLAAVEVEPDYAPPGGFRPDWVDADAEVYDEQAVLAGY
jgi:hypothetical protein